MYKETIETKYGKQTIEVDIYSCDFCGCELDDETPHMKIGEDKNVCRSCAFIKGLIDDKTFLSWCGVHLDSARAVVKDGQIHAVLSGKFAWEKNKNSDRFTKEYKKWRKSVFERDIYTCTACGKIGGNLNAHHIKPYATYKELRYELSNGITLCEDCHKSFHKRGEK
jgi:hypothetical protein